MDKQHDDYYAAHRQIDEAFGLVNIDLANYFGTLSFLCDHFEKQMNQGDQNKLSTLKNQFERLNKQVINIEDDQFWEEAAAQRDYIQYLFDYAYPQAMCKKELPF